MAHRRARLKRSAITGDKVLSYAQRHRRHSDPTIRAIAMSVIRQRESAAKRARRARGTKSWGVHVV